MATPTSTQTLDVADIASRGDVRRFGAKAVEDSPGFDSTAALLDAFGSGEPIHVPDGKTYLTESTLSPITARTPLRGSGTLKLADGGNTTVLLIDEITFIQWAGLRVNGNKANQSVAEPLVVLRNAAYSKLRGGFHIFDSKGVGLRIENQDASVLADEIDVDEGYIYGNAGHGIEVVATDTGGGFQAPGDLTFGKRLHVYGNGGCGMYFKGCNEISIDSQVLSNVSHGIEFDADVSNSLFAQRVLCQGMRSRNNGGSGVYAHAGGGYYRHSNIQFVGCHIHYNNEALGGSDNLTLFDAHNVQVVGCDLSDLGFTPRTEYGAHWARATQLRIVGTLFGEHATGHYYSETVGGDASDFRLVGCNDEADV